MEKRLLLAVVLSFFILYVWSFFTPKPANNLLKNISKSSQILENKEFMESEKEFESTDFKIAKTNSVSEVAQRVEKVLVKEDLRTMETEKLLADFSSIGGSLKSVTIKHYKRTFPITNMIAFDDYQEVSFDLVEFGGNTVKYVYDTDEIRITKSYQIMSNDYIIKMNMSLENKTGLNKSFDLSIQNYLIDTSNLDIKKGGAAGRDATYYEYLVVTDGEGYRKNNANKFSDKDSKQGDGLVKLVGFRDKYFCALFKPEFEIKNYFVEPISEKKLSVGIVAKDIKIVPGGSESFPITAFFGPEDLNLLQSYGEGFEKSKKFYRNGLLDAIAKIIYGLLHWIHKFIPNWGATIIVISTLIYFSMYPLTAKGMQSMRNMQALQPKVAQLKEKYKDNPEKLNKEMMGLYKEHKINPIGGCLPFFFQMPVFIGLYQVLWRDVAFEGAKFLWIKDLSQPDKLFSFGFKIPIIGSDFNLLPILMMIIMFFQQKISTKNTVLTDPAQIQQQKMMTTIMPVFLGIIFYKFASGLTLYFTMFYLFSTFTQWKMSKEKKAA